MYLIIYILYAYLCLHAMKHAWNLHRLFAMLNNVVKLSFTPVIIINIHLLIFLLYGLLILFIHKPHHFYYQCIFRLFFFRLHGYYPHLKLDVLRVNYFLFVTNLLNNLFRLVRGSCQQFFSSMRMSIILC